MDFNSIGAWITFGGRTPQQAPQQPAQSSSQPQQAPAGAPTTAQANFRPEVHLHTTDGRHWFVETAQGWRALPPAPAPEQSRGAAITDYYPKPIPDPPPFKK